MIIMGQWTPVENDNKVFLQVTNHTGQAEKNLFGPAGILRPSRFFSACPVWFVTRRNTLLSWKNMFLSDEGPTLRDVLLSVSAVHQPFYI